MIGLIQAAAVVLLTALDQFTKHLAVLHLKGERPLVLIDGIFELAYVENRGAAFGIFQDQVLYLAIFTGAIVAAIAVFAYRLPSGRHYMPMRICLVFLMAGAIGNLIDRVRLNFVVDFLYFKLIDFPVFNVADIYVVCASFALAFLMIFHYKDEELFAARQGKDA